MQKERNIGELLVANSVAATAGMEGNNIDGYISSLSVGEPVIVSASGIVVDATGTLPAKFKIGTKLTSGVMQWSDLIDAKSIKSIVSHKYTASTLQLDYIGYNGTSGSISVTNSNIYYIRMYYKPLDTAGFMQQKVKFGVYKSDSTATQAEIAAGLAKSLISNLSREPEKQKSGLDIIKVELVNSGTSIATSAGAITFTKGSKYVSWPEDGNNNDAGKYNADGADVAVGDYIRVGHATTKTFPVYKVVGITGAATTTIVLELDIAYQGASETVAAASVGVLPSANIGDFGIKLTGSAYSYDSPKFNYLLPRWDVTLEDFGTTEVTKSTATTEGNGDYRQIRDLEQQFLGNEGNYYRAQVPSPTFRSEVSSAKTYATLLIEHQDVMVGNLGNEEISLKQTYVACEKGAGGAYSDANTGLGTILNAYVTAYAIPLTYTTNATIATEINT